MKICWRRDRLPTLIFFGFPGGSAGKGFFCNAGDLGLIPELGRSPGEGKGYPLKYSGLENSIDCLVHGVTKSETQLGDFHFGIFFRTSRMVQMVKHLPTMQESSVRSLGWEDPLEKGKATHSSILAWRIP